MKITFTVEPTAEKVSVFATLVYEKMRKVMLVDPKYSWWNWRTYALREITKTVLFGNFSPTSFEKIKAAGFLEPTELDPTAFKKLRRTAKSFVKVN